jgi:alkylation response protein AidB-like acyl-CoA dehydrogenase
VSAPTTAGTEELLDRLRADAARLEREGVGRDDIAELARAGLLAVYGPPELGGLPRPAAREVAEQLAGASPDAWFVWFQHGPVVRMLAASDHDGLKDRYLPQLCAGAVQGGVAYSHLRTPKPSVLARRVRGGWSLTGPQPWCTGWPLVDVVLAGALDPEGDQVVFGLVPAGDRPELHSTGELRLAAMGGTRTHALAFDALVVPDDAVVAVRDRGEFTAYDTALNANVQPSTFGVARAALDLLAERQPAVADQLSARLTGLRTTAYRLLDEVPGDERLEERLAVRAQALLLALECCTALLTARGGQGMDLADPSQRLLRAAAFQLVHSQAAHVRAATLDALLS